MNHSYSDVQVYASKSFRSLLRKLDTLQSDQFYRLEKYVKPPKSFVRDGASSMCVKTIQNYYMLDDGLDLAVKHQVLQDTIDDWVALELYKSAGYNCFDPNHDGSRLFELTKTCLKNLESPYHKPEDRQKKEWIDKHAEYTEQLKNIGEYTVNIENYIDFASGQVSSAAQKVCATLNLVGVLSSTPTFSSVPVEPLRERVLSQRGTDDTGTQHSWDKR